MVARIAKHKARRRGGRPRKKRMELLSERRMVRLDPELDAVVEVVRKAKAAAAGVELESIKIQDVVRELMREGARARNLLPAAPQPA